MGNTPMTTGESVPANMTDCLMRFENTSIGDDFCPPVWDRRICWPPTPPGNSVMHPCAVFVGDTLVGYTANPDLFAWRKCLVTGQWLNNRTNSSICHANRRELYLQEPIVYAVCYMVLVFSTLSLITLGISLFIFCYFRSLHCSRLKVHRNLCVALIFYLLTVNPQSVATIYSIRWIFYDSLCKTITSLNLYSELSVVAWMFLEGLLLHSRVTVHIFKQDAPFKLYYFIGWGLPAILVAIWATIMSQTNRIICWFNYGIEPCVWVLTGPMLLALVVNALFLISIIRVLVTKHQASSATEAVQFRRAVKATALLFPLLGTTHLIFIFNPGGESFEDAFWIFNLFIRSSQGLFFGILYCFINKDVQTAIKNAYLRSVIRRNPNRSRFRTLRGMSQTSNTYISNSDGNLLDSTRHKRDSKVAIAIHDPYRSPQVQKYVVMTGDNGAKDSLTML